MSALPPKALAFTSMPGREACLCGIGARTPLGLGAAASAAAVRGGMSAIAVHPHFIDRLDEPMALARDAALDDRLDITCRLQRMLSSALAEALEDAGLAALAPPLACWLALPEPRPGLPPDIATCLAAEASRCLGPGAAVTVLPRGHAGGLMAMQAAAQAIAGGTAELAIVAGVDSYHDGETLAWLDEGRMLMSAANRGGFPPGEAAGACVLASRSAAARLSLPVRGIVRAACTALEAQTIRRTDGVCIGLGLSAVLQAVAPAGELITATYCDLNGERYRNEEFVYSLLRVQEGYVDAHDTLCPADCWGDVGAASGPLFAALAVSAQRRGYAKGALPLLWAGSESGHRSAVLLQLPVGGR